MSEKLQEIYINLCESIDDIFSHNECDIIFEEILHDEDLYSLYMENIESSSQRRKVGRTLHRGASTAKAARSRKKNEKKTLNTKQIMKKARQWAISKLKQKMTGKMPDDASVADRQRAEKRLNSPMFAQKIERLTKLRFRQLKRVGGHGSRLDDTKQTDDKSSDQGKDKNPNDIKDPKDSKDPNKDNPKDSKDPNPKLQAMAKKFTSLTQKFIQGLK